MHDYYADYDGYVYIAEDPVMEIARCGGSEYVGMFLLSILQANREQRGGLAGWPEIARTAAGGDEEEAAGPRLHVMMHDLIERGWWHGPGHDCPDCPQPSNEFSIVVHHFLQTTSVDSEV